ncbi:tRNA (adenosine(37)-N6)-threonylcarbamoyltransferase complex dimerization subunit type 1 TsaB [Pseudaminobacter soli (ex Li et al. 2025)]|uniref:tRNA (Adenosine(37)-N6)-threonylcarbamoyltransferase complex dimerization subunit type 1 TsaB n=1 Tax=Pseudaminobacter soli (ex Li et al. 2025) TaxID=1295366 RepID=A0A2P7S645_9HYPH|nr:tRNA (adenosine(37)-N6)-threonylcarbamoyltransferase complex dimerization subunit type 1 TsaB [Mesorhizobium soli]PSJ57933.1 tRNA (adenosine(37)-N6)-threonylcarbamoyltransferase complex dimerization subunit type 1 TsaB [Mesorhizobium soli]
MKLLAIDCSARLCAACVYDADAGKELGREVLDLGKGHAEHLMGVVEAAMKAGELAFADLGAVAVSVGPGSFTGVRVGVSATRGLALALGIPAIGVTTLEALAAEARALHGPRTVLAALDGGRGELQAAVYDDVGATLFEPAVIDLARATSLATEYVAALAGTAAEMIAATLPGQDTVIGPVGPTADIGVYAKLAAGKQPGERPKPLYLREPDAKPQAGFVLPRSG